MTLNVKHYRPSHPLLLPVLVY